MTKTSVALASQSALLNKFAAIARVLLINVAASKADKDKALAEVAELIGAEDEAAATAILANNPNIEILLDELAAAMPSGGFQNSDEATPVAS